MPKAQLIPVWLNQDQLFAYLLLPYTRVNTLHYDLSLHVFLISQQNSYLLRITLQLWLLHNSKSRFVDNCLLTPAAIHRMSSALILCCAQSMSCSFFA